MLRIDVASTDVVLSTVQIVGVDTVYGYICRVGRDHGDISSTARQLLYCGNSQWLDWTKGEAPLLGAASRGTRGYLYGKAHGIDKGFFCMENGPVLMQWASNRRPTLAFLGRRPYR